MLAGIVDAGREIPWKEAFALAAKGQTEFPFSLIKAMQENDNPERWPISASQLGYCLRQSLLKRTVDYYGDPGSHLPMMMGSWLHDIVEQYAAPASKAEIPVEWTTPEGVKVTGIVDEMDFTLGASNISISDWKTTRWLDPSKVPYGTHAIQVNVYRWLVQKSLDLKVTSLSIVYVDLTGPDKYGKHNGILRTPIEIWTDEAIDSFIRKNALTLYRAHFGEGDEDFMPPKVGRDKRWACRYCPARIKAECDRIGA